MTETSADYKPEQIVNALLPYADGVEKVAGLSKVGR